MNGLHIVLPLLALTLLQEPNLAPRVTHSVAPAHPLTTRATGLSIVEIELNGRTGSVKTRPVFGQSPFLVPALDALMGWGFEMPSGPGLSRTSVTFLFRSPAIYGAHIPDVPIKPNGDSPAFPRQIIDAVYPANSIAQGAVTLSAKISAEGAVSDIELVSGEAALSEPAREAVKLWKFAPARISGKNVSSTVYIVISFVRPT